LARPRLAYKGSTNLFTIFHFYFFKFIPLAVFSHIHLLSGQYLERVEKKDKLISSPKIILPRQPLIIHSAAPQRNEINFTPHFWPGASPKFKVLAGQPLRVASAPTLAS
jgi:hypothetical protein